MLNVNPGDFLLRISPPTNGHPGFSQRGYVEAVDENSITLVVQADVVRKMPFRRSDGMDLVGLGSFVVREDSITKRGGQ